MLREAHVCIHTNICVCVYAYIYIYIYTHSISNICSSRNIKKQSKLSYLGEGGSLVAKLCPTL